jgi:hypothetical protein
MHTTSKSLKVTAGTLALTLSVLMAVFGLTACGSKGGGHGGGGDSGARLAPSVIFGS